MAIQEGPVGYIAACGWSRQVWLPNPNLNPSPNPNPNPNPNQVWLWSDLATETEGRFQMPCLRAFSGHAEDVLCASFAAPNVLATGGYDGLILVWNLDSGALKGKL